MKLITEINEEVQYIKESKEDGQKNYFIEGIFMQAGIKNRNGRVYPVNVVAEEVERYNTEMVENKRAVGELGHPSNPQINLHLISHKFEKLYQEGNNFMGRAKILDTPNGRIVKALMEDDMRLGVSSRGLGSLKENNGVMEVQNDFYLATAGDIVSDPSAPEAFVNGIMEGVDYYFDAARGIPVAENTYDRAYEETKKMSKRELQENALRLWDDFMKSLR